MGYSLRLFTLYCIIVNAIEGRPQLDGPGHPGRRRRLVCGIDGVCDILRALDLRAQEVKERVGLAVDAARQLDLLDHLICCMV